VSDPELLATSLASAAGFDTDVVLGAVVTLGADAALAAGAALDGVLAGVSVLLDDFAVTGFLLFELAAGAGVLDVDLSDPLLAVADCWGLGVEIPGVEIPGAEIPGVETPGAIVFDAVALEAFEVEACEVVGLASTALDADLDVSVLDGAFFNALAAFLTAFTGAPGADAVDFFGAALLEAVLLEVVLLEVVLLEAAWFKAALLGATLLDEPCMLTETLLTEALLAEALPVEPLLMEALPTCDVALAVLRAMEGAGDLAPAAALDIVCRLAPACGLVFALDALAADAPAPFEMAVFFSADILGTPVSPRCGDGAKAGRKRRPGRTRP